MEEMDKRMCNDSYCFCSCQRQPYDGVSLAKGPAARGSPFLFLFAAEGLNVVMSSLVDNNLFTGYGVGTSNAVSVSHLQFTDDTLLLGAKS
jgi:hypothetical protein